MFLTSPKFKQQAEKAIAQVLVHRNTTPLHNLLAQFERTQYFKGLAAYFRDQAGVLLDVKDGRILLKIGSPPGGTNAALSAYLHSNKGSLRELLGPGARMSPIAYVDALKPWVRLPGSYETGNRR